MKYISPAGTQCCTKHSKAPGSAYAAVHSDGSERREAGDERYLHPRSPRPSRPLHAPQAGPRKVAMRPSPLPSEPASCPPPRQQRSRPTAIPDKAERCSPESKSRPPQAASRRRQHSSASGKVTRGSKRKRRSIREEASCPGRSSHQTSRSWSSSLGWRLI